MKVAMSVLKRPRSIGITGITCPLFFYYANISQANKTPCKPTSLLCCINGSSAAKQDTRYPWMRQRWIGLCRMQKRKSLARLTLQVSQPGGENENPPPKYWNRHS